MRTSCLQVIKNISSCEFYVFPVVPNELGKVMKYEAKIIMSIIYLGTLNIKWGQIDPKDNRSVKALLFTPSGPITLSTSLQVGVVLLMKFCIPAVSSVFGYLGSGEGFSDPEPDGDKNLENVFYSAYINENTWHCKPEAHMIQQFRSQIEIYS